MKLVSVCFAYLYVLFASLFLPVSSLFIFLINLCAVSFSSCIPGPLITLTIHSNIYRPVSVCSRGSVHCLYVVVRGWTCGPLLVPLGFTVEPPALSFPQAARPEELLLLIIFCYFFLTFCPVFTHPSLNPTSSLCFFSWLFLTVH